MEFAVVVASSWRFLRTKSSACFTVDRSSGDVAVVAAVANGATIRGAAGDFTGEGGARAGEVAFAAVAVSASSASDSGPPGEAVDGCEPLFGLAAASGLAALLVGRSRGSGMGSDGRAASTCAITSMKPAVA